MLKPFAVTLTAGLAIAGAALANPTSRDPAQLPAGRYALDDSHSSMTAKLPHSGGFSNFTLMFDKLDGGFTYDPANLAATKVTINVDLASVHTGIGSFDKQLQGQTFLNAAQRPKATFVSTAVTAGPDGRGQVTGDLTFHGVTRPVTLDVTFNGFGPGLFGAGTRLGFSGTGRIKRSDFGMTNPAPKDAGDDVALAFEIEFTKK
jgi:polyisoprenoid-binding protein YceI